MTFTRVFLVALSLVPLANALVPSRTSVRRGQLEMSKKSTLYTDWSKVNKPLFLKDPLAGFGPGTQWLPKTLEGNSGALPWSEAPLIGDGSLAGDQGFDPWGLSKLFPLSWLRAAELKHGRVCMLAAVGLIAPELVQHPIGYEGLKFAPEFTEMNAFKALGSVPGLGLAQIFLVAGIVELFTFKGNYDGTFSFEDGLSDVEKRDIETGAFKFLTGGAKNTVKANTQKTFTGLTVTESVDAGNLGFDPLGFADDGINPDYALAELKHGRLAMLGTLGMLIQQGKTPDFGLLEYTGKYFSGEV